MQRMSAGSCARQARIRTIVRRLFGDGNRSNPKANRVFVLLLEKGCWVRDQRYSYLLSICYLL